MDSIDVPVARRRFLAVSGGLISAAVAPAAALQALAAAPAPPGPNPSKTMTRTALIYDDIYKQHLTGTGHPESPRRCDAVMKALRESNFAERLHETKPRAADDEAIHCCHTKPYVQGVTRDIASGARQLSTGDTELSPRSLEAAIHAAGGVLEAVDAVMAGKVANAFCVVRPPGHHAGPQKGQGFCIFNNAAIAARYAQRKHKIGKVLIVDWDVHHGNGTQDIFYEDGSVFYFSTHQWPWYPGTGRADETGAGKAKGMILNCPLPAGSGRKAIVGAFQDKLVPAADGFKPEFVLISAGFDSREGDPLGGFRLTDNDFMELTSIVLKLARQHAAGRLVSVLEGGYSLTGLAAAATAHVRTLCGDNA